jgi:hypothetical protein
MKFYEFLERRCDGKSRFVRALWIDFFLVLLTFAISVDASTSSRVKFSNFELSPFDCTVAATSATSQPQQVSPYIVAEQVRSIAEDCLRIAVPLDCEYGSVGYIGLGNAVCENNSITIRGGVMDFTSSDDIPSPSDVAQCLRTAIFSATCRDMIQSNFPSVTSFDYQYLTPAPAPVLVSTESTNDKVSQPVLNTTDETASQNAVSIATVLGAVGGGAVVLALLGFMAAIRQKKRGSSEIRHESYCVHNPEDLEGGHADAVACLHVKPCDDDDDAQTPTTLSVNDGSNSSFEDDVVVVNTGESDSCDQQCDSQKTEQPIIADADEESQASEPHKLEKGIPEQQPLLSSGSTPGNLHRKEDSVVNSMKSWMGFHLDFQHRPTNAEEGLDDFAPDDVWDPDDNSVSSVDLECLAIAGTGELSFAPSPQRIPTKERLPVIMPSFKQESSHRRSQSVTELFPATMTTTSFRRISTSNSMPSFEKWNVNWSTHWKQEYESLNEPRPPPTPPRKYLAMHVCRLPKSTRDETFDSFEDEI